MSEFEKRRILTQVFIRLRRSGFPLGVGELIAAFKAIDGGWGKESEDDLKRVVRLLWWCSQYGDEFDKHWASVLTNLSEMDERDEDDQGVMPHIAEQPDPHEQEMRSAHSALTQAANAPPSATREWTALPVQMPSKPDFADSQSDLNAYWPVTRRHMIYTWRHLRRPVPDGPPNILDVDATVDRATRQGFYLIATYRRGERNDAQLTLLVDQGGSMTPFHRFTRDLVDTASGDESSIRQTGVLYFHNIPSEKVYADVHLTEPILWSRASALWSGDTSILLVSDAGAARGQRRTDRIRATTQFLSRLKRITTRIAWLNPMPEERWAGTSAQTISHMVAMFQMDPAGFSNAIDVLRGQLSHYVSRI
jgi:uncharacterized protein with von Willebrand factor type A (vWA) domain